MKKVMYIQNTYRERERVIYPSASKSSIHMIPWIIQQLNKVQISSLFYFRLRFFPVVCVCTRHIMCENEGLKVSKRILLRHQLAAMYIKRVIKNLSHLVCTSMMMMMMRLQHFSHSQVLVNFHGANFFFHSTGLVCVKQKI